MRITVDTDGFDDIADTAKIAARQAKLTAVVEKTGADIEAGAKSRSRVDTGTMRAGWEHRTTAGAGEIYTDVSNAVDYTIHNEFGTWKMPAQPMAIPALDQAAPGFVAAVEQVIGEV